MSISTKKVDATRGFTLLEILLVVGIIAILAGIVILAINPTKQLGDTRNAQRRSDVLTILNAIYQFSIDNNGLLPTDDGSPTGSQEITSTDACGFATDMEIDNGDNGSQVNLYTSLVGSDSKYLTAIPSDPQATSTDSTAGSGYAVTKTSSGRITVCAPLSVGEGNIVDEDDMIKVTR